MQQDVAHKSDCSAHTPGPWKHDGGGGVIAPMVTETLSSGRTVSRRVATAKGTSIEEVDANARLIAAAPDMLAALKALVAKYGDFAPGQPYAVPADHPLSTARAAIAKAEGRQ